MTIGAAWRFGVWHPFPNPHFRRPQRMVSALSADFISGTSIFVNASDLHFLASVRAGDIVRSVSTYTGFEGRQFYGRIQSVGSNFFTLTEANAIKLRATDPLICWTTKAPEGFYTTNGLNWDIQGIVHDNLNYPFDNHYALRLSVLNQAAESNYICTTRTPLLLSTAYYSSVIYKAASIGNCRVFFFKNDGSTLSFATLEVNSTWSEAVTSGLTTMVAAEYTGKASFDIYRSSGNDSGLFFKTIVMMHAAETSAEALGVYTLPKNPERFTLTVANSETRLTEVLDDRTYMKYSFQRSSMLRLSAQFSFVSQTILDDLQALIDWQDQGNLICLNASLNSIPKWLIGVMEIRAISRNILTNEVSFTLVFEEKI